MLSNQNFIKVIFRRVYQIFYCSFGGFKYVFFDVELLIYYFDQVQVFGIKFYVNNLCNSKLI